MVNLINRVLSVALVFAMVAAIAVPAMAQPADETTAAGVPTNQKSQQTSEGLYAEALGLFGALLGTGLIVFGAALGISRIASGATEAIARQPEAGGRVFTTMIIAASLIEGIAFFGLIVCFIAVLSLT